MNKNYKRILQFLIGMFLLILGVKFILFWWEDLLIVLRGVVGIILALTGLIILYVLNQTKK